MSLYKFFLFFLFFCVGSISDGQNITKDSIDLYLKNIKLIDDDFNSEIFKLCRKIEQQNNTTELYQYMDSVAPNPKSKLLFYNRYISHLYRVEQEHKGLEKGGFAIKLAKQHQLHKVLFEYTQLKSYGFIMTAAIDSALYYANAAESIIIKNKDLLGDSMHKIYLIKADIEALMGNFSQRDSFFEKAVESIEAYPKSKRIAYVLSTVTYHFKMNKNYEKHSFYSQKLKAYYQKKGGYGKPNRHLSISSFLEFEDTNEQVNALKKSLNITKNAILTNTQRFNINTLSESLINIGKLEEAIQYLKYNTKDNDSLPLAHKLMSYSLLEKAYSLINDCDNTLATVHKKAELIDSIRSQEMIAKIADSKVKYETEKKEAQLQLLKLEKEKEKQKKNLFTIIAILGIGLLTIICYFLYKNAKKNKKLNDQNTLLERTLDEKNVLLKETHHRVKNSFQIVSSLLYLQSESIEDKEAKIAIKEAENRVRSMVLVHQRLYNKDELVGINAKDYLNDLVKDIFESHQFNSNPIEYDLDAESHVLDIETITPIGLILNELIINTLKHAFDKVTAKSKIDIQFKKTGENLELSVIDNGQGFEGEVKNTSFGITLMKALSKKLNATLNYASKIDQGTKAILTIKKYKLL